MKKIPNSVCWNITNKCNDECKFCYRDKISCDLGFSDNIKILDNLAKEGIRKITFAGGEPLLYPRILELIKYAKNKNMITSITTNAILLDDMKLKELREIVDWITLSLDGHSQDIQEGVSRNKNHFNNVINVLKKIKSENIDVKIKINTLVCRKNMNSIKNIISIIEEYNINRWKLFQFIPLRGEARNNTDDFYISDEEYQNIKKSIHNYYEDKSTEKMITFTDRDDLESGYFVVFPNGDVKISSNMNDTILGNVLKDNIYNIWNQNEFRHDLHDNRTIKVIE